VERRGGRDLPGPHPHHPHARALPQPGGAAVECARPALYGGLRGGDGGWGRAGSDDGLAADGDERDGADDQPDASQDDLTRNPREGEAA
jgi:hypothetical protein